MKKRFLQLFIISLVMLFTLTSCNMYIIDKTQEEIRYTITESEWEALTKESNFTLVKPSLGSVEKFTNHLLDVNGSITLFIGEKQFSITQEEECWVAYDHTFMDLAHGPLFEGMNYSDYQYDEEEKIYYNKDFEEYGRKFEIRFENGIPTSINVVYSDRNNVFDYENKFEVIIKDIGTTIIDLPEYIFEHEYYAMFDYTITEEVWNKYANQTNYVLDVYGFNNYEMIHFVQKSSGDAYEIDDSIIVIENGKKYILELKDDVWYAKEYVNKKMWEGLLLKDFDYNDFEYDKETRKYVQKNNIENDIVYSLAFEEGQLLYIFAEKISDPSNPDLFDVIAYDVIEIGTVEIDVPEYVIENN